MMLVTTMNAAGYSRYGRQMLATFQARLTSDVILRIYAEGFQPEWNVLPAGAEVMDLDAAAPWLADFKAWCDQEPLRRGQTPGGYNMRMDAKRFSHKVAAFIHAALEPAAGRLDLLGWVDADTVAHEPVDAAWLDGLLPAPAYLAWLDRIDMYPECGFFLTRPRHPAHADLWAEVRALYETRALVQHLEWHDSFLIQQVMERAQREGQIQIASLSGMVGKRTSHPLVNGPVGARLDHLKGPRKERGRSGERDLKTRRAEPYWSR
jgi:hypothetical protein